MSFKKEKYQLVKKAISLDLAEHACTEFQLISDFVHYSDKKSVDEYFWSDPQCPKSFAWYSPFFADSLLLLLKPKIEKITGLVLHPAYSYARIYYPGCDMQIHKDRPSCQISATLTLGTLGKIWPIWFENVRGETLEINIPVGDMIVYKGCELNHWRNPMPDNVIKQYQVFLHYVDSNGPYKDHRFDKRPMLGHPSVR